jgi:hypothetical protein
LDVDYNNITWQAVSGVHINKFHFAGNNSGVRYSTYEDKTPYDFKLFTDDGTINLIVV